ncbi:MAG: hypothetical protein ACUVV5_11260 [Candidatus Aminicenantales bacterium]
MARGWACDQAMEKAHAVEKRERRKVKLVSKISKCPKSPREAFWSLSTPSSSAWPWRPGGLCQLLRAIIFINVCQAAKRMARDKVIVK